jgi:CheY-like chemotaxis protein
MSVLQEWVQVAQGVAAVITAVAWLVIAGIAVRLLPEMRRLSRRLEEFTIEGPLGTTIRIKAARAARHVQDAVKRKLGESTTVADTRRWLDSISPETLRSIQGARALWTDDKPNNNTDEIAAFGALGISVDTANDTADAIAKLSSESYDLVITNMGRPSGQRAGYDLLSSIRKLQPSLPVIIYSSSNKPEHKREATKHGAAGATADPRELLKLVVSTLSG